MFLRKDYMGNKIIIGNMKMYMNISDIKDYLNKIENKMPNNVILCPTSIYIPYFLEKKYKVAIQNVYFEDNGAYTGEISVEQVKNIGINYIVIGHSERREYFHETDYDINKKVIKALNNNLKIIICIGETIFDKNNFNTNNILREQLEISLNNISSKYQDSIIIAYEPRWAIGSGILPNNYEIFDTINYIKTFIKEKYNMNIKVVYGGSINDNNIDDLNKIDNIDGFMIGGSCTNPEKFLKIISVINGFDNI